MNDRPQTTLFDPEEIGRFHAQELITLLASDSNSAETFIAARAKLRQALLKALDAADPAQALEDARQAALPDALRGHQADASEQRRKDRGSVQDPMYPPTRSSKHWD